MPWLLLAAVLAVYIILGMLYESLIHPITILSTIPSAGLGALLTMYMPKNELDLVSMIGIILLIGIVKKNAIMMVDFALEAERQEGLTPRRVDLSGVPGAVPAHHDDDFRCYVRRIATRYRHGCWQ